MSFLSGLLGGAGAAPVAGAAGAGVASNAALAAGSGVTGGAGLGAGAIGAGAGGWGSLAQEAGKSAFKNIKSVDMPPGMKGLAQKESGKYTPGIVGPNAPQGIKAVKGMEQETFTLDKEQLAKLQKGLEERAKNRADLAGYNRESSKYPDLAPREDEETSWKNFIHQYYENGYDQWSFMD